MCGEVFWEWGTEAQVFRGDGVLEAKKSRVEAEPSGRIAARGVFFITNNGTSLCGQLHPDLVPATGL